VVVVTFLPIGPWPVLLVLAVAALVAVWWNPASRSVPGESRATH
jgi:Ca-activated chloride channel homolog